MNRRRPSRTMRFISAVTLLSLASCASTTVIQSQPSGPRLFLNGEPGGPPPYTMTDTKIVGSATTVRLEYPGFEPLNGAISRNEEFEVGACIGGVLILFPFLWIMGYKPAHTFELRPAGGYQQGYPPTPSSSWEAPPAGYPPPPPGSPPPPPRYPPPPAPPA